MSHHHTRVSLTVNRTQWIVLVIATLRHHEGGRETPFLTLHFWLSRQHAQKRCPKGKTVAPEAFNNARHYSCVGIGVGPANLSLASLMQSHPEITNLFLDKKESFGWHDGQQIPG